MGAKLTLLRLRELNEKLHRARGDEATYGCRVPRTGPNGETHRLDPRPDRRLPNGAREARQPVKVPHGPHGVAFLVIDPETGEVGCGAVGCPFDAGLDATVYPTSPAKERG